MQPAMEVTQRFVWGLDYIDEKIASYGPDGSQYFTLQDANYNVVGKVRGYGMYELYQYAYDPYGQIIAAENVANGQSLDINLNGELPDTHYFAGAWLDKETGLVWMRNRLYSPILKRFISQDPNGQALVLGSVLARNAQSMMATAGLSMGSQYADGMNLYSFARGNPITGRDPSGLFSYADISITTALQTELIGQTMDNGIDVVGASLGVIALGNDRNAALDRMLNVVSSDSTSFIAGAFLAIEYYRAYQVTRMAITGGIAAAKIMEHGKRLFQWFARKARGAPRLIETLRGGMNSVRRFFGFAEPDGQRNWLRFWNPPKNVNGRRVYQRDDLFDPQFVSSWKERGNKVTGTNVARMRSGRAPVGYDGQSVEMHHLTQDEPGAMAELAAYQHAEYRDVLHMPPNTHKSFRNDPDSAKAYTNWRSAYWKTRAEDFR